MNEIMAITMEVEMIFQSFLMNIMTVATKNFLISSVKTTVIVVTVMMTMAIFERKYSNDRLIILKPSSFNMLFFNQ